MIAPSPCCSPWKVGFPKCSLAVTRPQGAVRAPQPGRALPRLLAVIAGRGEKGFTRARTPALPRGALRAALSSVPTGAETTAGPPCSPRPCARAAGVRVGVCGPSPCLCLRVGRPSEGSLSVCPSPADGGRHSRVSPHCNPLRGALITTINPELGKGFFYYYYFFFVCVEIFHILEFII